MKYIIIALIILTLFMFLSITDAAQECKQNGGEYINTNNGGKCFDKKIIIDQE